ncbi:MAG: alkane 1-monooxygenase [Ginsengibacter sp.]
MKPWNYLLLLLLPAMVVAGHLLGGWWNFLVPVCCFVAYPLANLFIAGSEEHTHAVKQQPSSVYSLVALIFVPVLLGLTTWCIYVSTAITNAFSFAGFALSLGIINGVLGFTLAHEFIHHSAWRERFAGYLLLLQNNYMHYGVEHVWGHHVYACTSKDPHTARVGESLYAYIPRAVVATYKNAVAIQAKKLARSSKPFFSIYNGLLVFGILQVLLMTCIFFAVGFNAFLFFLLQNIVAVALLHIINYLQHYGLMRDVAENGSYEKLNAHHAWRTGRHNSTVDLFHLENHAHHHMRPSLSFNELRDMDESPEHPAGYSFMVLLSLIPPLWFRIMNKKISSHPINTSS